MKSISAKKRENMCLEKKRKNEQKGENDK